MTTSPELEGVLRVDKPVGPTSHDVVAAARRALQTRRIGHTGTLDPFASGLLLLCVGRATRIAEYLSAQPKQYRAVMRLGEATDTEDPTGTVTAVSDRWRELAADRIAGALERQRGRQLQRPPAYSAKKVAGTRLYELARRGEVAEAPAAEILVHEIALTAWSPPDAWFEITCSSGTYVRSIARDVGLELGTYAHLVALRRTAIGSLSVDGAVTLDELAERGPGQPLIPPLEAIAHLPRLAVDDTAAADVRHGRAIPIPADVPDGLLALAWQGRLLAIATASGGMIRPRKVLLDG